MKFVSMKYSLVILNITFMLSSVQSQRRLSFRPIILDNSNDVSFRPSLPTDGWVNPYDIMMDYEWKLLCEEHITAQRIRYSSSRKSESIILNFKKIETNTGRVFVTINENSKNVAIGVTCLDSEKLTFFLKNKKYEGFLLFSYETTPPGNQVIVFQGFITNHLSYEDIGSYAISIFENSGIPVDYKEQQFVRICASLFQGLSSDLVQSFAYYSINQKTKIIDGNICLYCTGVMPIQNQVFIGYKVIIKKYIHGDEIIITHITSTGVKIITKTLSQRPENLK